MQQSTGTTKDNIRKTRSQTMGFSCNKKADKRCCYRITRKPFEERTKTSDSISGTISEECQRATRDKRCSCSGRLRISLIKKKGELGLKGKLKGYFSKEIKEKVLSAIKESIDRGLSRKQSCNLFGLDVRKYRRWSKLKPKTERTAWNKIRPEEKEIIKNAAYNPELIGKPLSHIYVYGQEKGLFFASISTIWHVLKEFDLVKPIETVRKRNTGYVSAHDLLEQGFYLLTYDGTTFRTETNMLVIAIPVLLLPFRYLLHIGHSLQGEKSSDLQKAVDEAISVMPEKFKELLLAHSDRGSAMKSKSTLIHLQKVHGIQVHFGRPHTPDDNPWIESLNKSMKYHREAPKSYQQVQDVLDWFDKFQNLHNNEPHSSLKYVTPTQFIEGRMEVILEQRKQNLLLAKKARLEAYHASKKLVSYNGS